MTDDTAARFWAKVEKTDGCWNWTGSKTPKGYGQIRIDRRNTYAHRYSALLSGRDPRGFVVDHTCHNPSCVRPDHLRLVTSKQNSENLAGAHRDNKSGVRGVSWDKRNRKWIAQAHSLGVRVFKRFADLADAEAWARARRIELFTHNDADREPESMSIVRGV